MTSITEKRSNDNRIWFVNAGGYGFWVYCGFGILPPAYYNELRE